ncbi:MAG: hypothetical protein AMXMBFR36_03910 [Acidobacteriota bacterium]
MPNPWPRRLVALFLHAPGLWLIFREPLPKELRRPNLVAATATLGAMAATFWLAPAPWGRPWGVLAAWLAGHLAWGAYLTWDQSRRHRSPDTNSSDPFSK